MESGTHAMEVITAVIDGPLCFLVVFAAAHDLSWRHPLQLILCTMQLYGLVWFTLQPIWSDTGLAGHFSSDPVRQTSLASWVSVRIWPVGLVCVTTVVATILLCLMSSAVACRCCFG